MFYRRYLARWPVGFGSLKPKRSGKSGSARPFSGAHEQQQAGQVRPMHATFCGQATDSVADPALPSLMKWKCGWHPNFVVLHDNGPYPANGEKRLLLRLP